MNGELLQKLLTWVCLLATKFYDYFFHFIKHPNVMNFVFIRQPNYKERGKKSKVDRKDFIVVQLE